MHPWCSSLKFTKNCSTPVVDIATGLLWFIQILFITPRCWKKALRLVRQNRQTKRTLTFGVRMVEIDLGFFTSLNIGLSVTFSKVFKDAVIGSQKKFRILYSSWATSEMEVNPPKLVSGECILLAFFTEYPRRRATTPQGRSVFYRLTIIPFSDVLSNWKTGALYM